MSEKQFVLSIDPGVSTGIALLSFDEDSPAQLVEGWQFTGGVRALLDWYTQNVTNVVDLGVHVGANFDPSPVSWWLRDTCEEDTTVISEKFTARNTRGFSYTTASLEPLRGEGVLIALGLMPDYTAAEKRWRDPKYQYLVGGKDKADKKKRMHAFLKDNGFYRTGRDLGSPDADDFRSACAHGIVYVARELKHRPTFDMIAGWIGEK